MKTERNKVEIEFKHKLDERTIQPSEMAWDRLDAMLSVSEKKRPNRAWLYIAASFLGFLLIGTIFFNSAKINTTDGVVVDDIQNSVVEEVPLKEQDFKEQKKDNSNALETKIIPAINKKIIAEDNPIVAVPLNNLEEKVQPEKFKYIDAQNLLAAIDDKSDIAIKPEPAVKKSAIKVDSQSLLSSVENELDNTFREKAIKAINKNYNVVKTSLANRNYE